MFRALSSWSKHLELSAQVANHLPLSRLNLTSGRLLRISLQQSESAHSLLTRSAKGFASACPIAKDCLLTCQEQTCFRITWTRLGVRHHAENGLVHRKMVVDWPLVSQQKRNPFRDQERVVIGPASQPFAQLPLGLVFFSCQGQLNR